MDEWIPQLELSVCDVSDKNIVKKTRKQQIDLYKVRLWKRWGGFDEIYAFYRIRSATLINGNKYKRDLSS